MGRYGYLDDPDGYSDIDTCLHRANCRCACGRTWQVTLQGEELANREQDADGWVVEHECDQCLGEILAAVPDAVLIANGFDLKWIIEES